MSTDESRRDLEKLPEPILRALIEVAVAAAALSQLEKRQATVVLQQTAKTGGLLSTLLEAVSGVVDSFHTAAEPEEIRSHVVEDKVAQRREADLLMGDPDVADLLKAIRRRTEGNT